LLYKLADYGVAPSEGACIEEAYKPGWYAYYDEVTNGPSNDACSIPGSHLWTGPAHVCPNGFAPGGPFDSGLYGPGAFERGLNAYFRELFAALAARGYSDVQVFTAERPSYRTTAWTLLDDDLKRSPQLIGEWAGGIEPKLSAAGPRDQGAAPPPPCRPDRPRTPTLRQSGRVTISCRPSKEGALAPRFSRRR